MLSACSRFPVWLNLTCLFVSLSPSLSLFLTPYILLLVTLPPFHSPTFHSHFLSSLFYFPLCISLFSFHVFSPSFFLYLSIFLMQLHSSYHFLPASLCLSPPSSSSSSSSSPLSFSDSTPCSLHVYFWSLSSSPHASITSPWFSLSVSLSSSLLPLSLLRYLLFPNLSHPHVHACTRAPTQTYTCPKTHLDAVFERHCILRAVILFCIFSLLLGTWDTCWNYLLKVRVPAVS